MKFEATNFNSNQKFVFFITPFSFLNVIVPPYQIRLVWRWHWSVPFRYLLFLYKVIHEDFPITHYCGLSDVRRLITIKVWYWWEAIQPTFHLSVRIWLHLFKVPPMIVAPCGGGWAQRAEIGMSINLPGHPISVTQWYLSKNDTHVIRVVYSFSSFRSDWMWCLCL